VSPRANRSCRQCHTFRHSRVRLAPLASAPAR